MSDRLVTRPFVFVFVANLLQALAFNLFLHFPGFLKQLGADELQIGFISALTAVAAIALRPPIGRAMDRRGRRGVILAGGVLNVLVVGLYLTVTEVGPWLYTVRIGHGLAEALLFSSLFTYAADCVPAARRTQGLALFGVSGMLPISIGAAAGDWLLAVSDYGALFMLAEVLAVVSLVFSLPLYDRPRPQPPDRDAPALGIRAALSQRDLIPLWWIGTIFSIALTAFFVFIKTFVDETGIGTVGGFFTAYTAAALVLRVFFGWVPDRVGPKRVLFPALVALSAGFLVLARGDGPADVALAGVLCGIGHGYTFPILFGMVVTRTPEANRGAAMAVFTALFDLGVLLGGPLFGALIEWRGYPTMFAAGAVLIACGAVVFFLWDARIGRAALVAFVAVGVGCAAPGAVESGLEPHRAALAPHWGHRLRDAHPYVWPRDGELWLLLCRWPDGAEVGVGLEGAATLEEVAAFKAALRAWAATPLGVTLVRRPPDAAAVRVGLQDEVPDTAAGLPGRGLTVADCDPGSDGDGARLVSARVTVTRFGGVDRSGAPRKLSQAELAGTLVHELGHALGYQGHPALGSAMARERGLVREVGERAQAGSPESDATLAALYALPSGTVLARLPSHPVRTRDVDRFAELAARDGLRGPWLRVGDQSARIFWRGADEAEYGFVLVNLRETLRSPGRAVIVAEEAARARLDAPDPATR